MPLIGPLKRLIASVASVIAVAVTLAVPIGAVVDRGPSGEGRITAFHLVLAISDHAASDAIRNSLVLASGVASASLMIGLALGCLVANREFPGRHALVSLARMSGAIPPLFAALGLVALTRFVPEDLGATWRWFSLGWVEIAWGVPRVMDAALSAFSRTPSAWEDAARLAGAGRRRAWWASAWPMGRHRVMKSVAEVFAAVLFEPGGPLALGMRATLSYQIVSAALASDRLGRAASLAVIGLVSASIARRLILWRPAPSWPDCVPIRARAPRRNPIIAIAGTTLVFSAWAAFAMAPTIALVASSVALNRPGRGTFSAFLALSAGPALAMLRYGLVLGLSASMIAGLMAWGSGGKPSKASWRRPSSWPRGFPPLAIGLGAMLLPMLLDAGAGRLGGGIGPRGLHLLADTIDPYVAPWTLLIISGAILRVPEMSDALRRCRSPEDRPRADAARTLGVSRVSAWIGVAWPRFSTVMAGAFAWSIARSALDLGSTLLLAPTLAARPISPGVLTLAAMPGGMRPAAAMATLGLLLPLFAWIIGGGRPRPS